jgi:glucan phosphoethanolaminetransferase (alkaline phosphatase superfamily)
MPQKFKRTLLVLSLLWAFVLLPDIIYGWFDAKYIAGLDGKSAAISVLLVTLLMFSRTPRLNLVVLSLFFIWQSSQLMYFQYYGAFYSAFDMGLIFAEAYDALFGFLDVIQFLVLPWCLSALFFAAAFYTYKRLHTQIVTVPYISVLFILLMLLPLLQSIKSDSSQKFQPNIAHSSLKNGFYSYSYFFAREGKLLLGLQKPATNYLPYELVNKPVMDANVVVIMGESLSYMNMGLFGYERNTTPDLAAYSENESFIYKPSLSSAVSTRVSLALFFNTVYEPDNVAHISHMDTALFKLAKQSGFNTHYITTQKNAGGLTYSFSPSHIDSWQENKHLSRFESTYDDRLLLALDEMKLDYSQPQFITLHMRSTHTPYVDNYPKSQEVYPVEGKGYEDYMINSYDNSVLYTQKVITDIYAHFEKTNKPTYIFFTSDHGELMGQGGRFGHNAVDLDIARVPFLFYGVNLDKREIDKIDQTLGCMPNHYTIGKEVARILGYEIINPNEKAGEFYLNGVDAFGAAGYLKYQQQEVEQQACKG